MVVNGKTPHGMIGPGTIQRRLMQPKAKDRKARRAKEEASMEKMERMHSPAPRTEPCNLPMLPRAVQCTATTTATIFFVDQTNSVDFSCPPKRQKPS